MPFQLAARRATYLDVTDAAPARLTPDDVAHFETVDMLYRALCALLFNFVPTSGHPGGSISSGRIVAALLFDTLDYDLAEPDRADADIISYAAGHKAMGLYAMWALRDEIARLAAPHVLPGALAQRLRLEDLLGFRRNPITRTPLIERFGARALDGHPTPATPFVRLSTGASGVGIASSLGLAIAARDYYGAAAPRVHIVEGEGGLTPGRVAEALATAGTASLDNVIVHVDWNQASIDSNRVCRDDGHPGDYVQWTPMELFHLHDWNVVYVPDGKDVRQVITAQRAARAIASGQPTAIVYRTVKGWQYGVEGKTSHGAGHGMCSSGFCQAVAELTGRSALVLPTCAAGEQRCQGSPEASVLIEACFWDALQVVRSVLEASKPTVDALAERLVAARTRLFALGRQPRASAPRVDAVWALADRSSATPPELTLAPGTVTTLRGELGRALSWYNRASGGAIMIAAADLLGSTSIGLAADGFVPGFWNAATNPASRVLSVGGICEDAMSGIMAGLSTFGRHIGAGSSYGAFMAPLSHIAARLHAIGGQARRARTGESYTPMIAVCAHAGLKTGEDGPTHADPQALQVLQENFPRGTAITLTPWDPQEVFPLLTAALARRPAVIAPFVTRPNETVVDRAAAGLPPAETAVQGVYPLRRPRGRGDGTVVLQESGVAYAFVRDALPLIDRDGLDLSVYYVASAELFDLLSPEAQRSILPEERAQEAMGITGFTLPTMLRWVCSDAGRAMTLHPFRAGHFLGSGQGDVVLEEAGLDGVSQYRAIKRYLDARVVRSGRR